MQVVDHTVQVQMEMNTVHLLLMNLGKKASQKMLDQRNGAQPQFMMIHQIK